MSVTIKDVAKAAGVSPSTVSRVLAGNARISLKTQEKVRQALKELNYHPHAGARSLVTGSSRTIGLITSRPSAQTFATTFFPEVIQGISSVLEDKGYHLLLSTVQDEAHQRDDCLAILRSRQADGVILTLSQLGDPLIDALMHEHYPFVLIGRPAGPDGSLSYPEVPFVNNDNVSAAASVVEHLTGLGHRRIGFVTGPRARVYCYDRLEGYRTGLAEAGIPFDEALVMEGNLTQQDANQALRQLLALADPPTAVIAVDDTLALGVLEAALHMGLRIPGDLAIAGFNDSPLWRWIQPPLTTVRIPDYDLGVMAARMLIGFLKGRPSRPHQVILPSQLIVRASTVGS